MIQTLLEESIGFVTDHNRIVLLVMLVLTAGMIVGIGHLDMQSQAEEESDELGDTEPAQAADYVDDREYFTLGGHAMLEANEVMNQNTVQLILPVALALILGVLALVTSFVVSVFVLPNMLLVWAQYLYEEETSTESTVADVEPTMD
ncbi:hypothetical protein ACYJ1Y_11650 [Natrialbaceae archaeon A-gly3]